MPENRSFGSRRGISSKPILCALLTLIQLTSASSEDELQPPHSVRVLADAEHSLTLSWQKPEDNASSRGLLGYSIHYYSQLEPEKEIKVPVDKNSQMIGDLTPDTKYTIYVTAHYMHKTVSSPKFIVSTLKDPSTSIYRDCTCYEEGTKHCNKLPSGGECVCKEGYEGPICDVCLESFYRSGDKCIPCPCSKESSVGSCDLGTSKPGEVTCECKPGYFGTLCDACVRSYYPVQDWCIPCHCLFCRSDQPRKSCDHCPPYSHNFTDHVAVMHNCGISGYPRSEQRMKDHGDGTVAVVAVFTSLAFIGCVAGTITCYRRRMQARNQPPFWSIELAEDKISLNTGSDYQRLDGASKHSSRNGHQRSPSVAEATAQQRMADQPQYNCISI